MPVQIIQEISDCTGFLLVAVFYKSGGSPLCSFNIMAILSSMRVPHAAGIFQTRTNEGEVGKLQVTALLTNNRDKQFPLKLKLCFRL